MSENLIRRIFTSLLLLSILFISIFINHYSWLLLIILRSTICFFEFSNLSKKIWKKKISYIYFVNLMSFFYLIIFVYSAYYIYLSGLVVIIFIILTCVFSDIGGYTIGKTNGGKKLTKISPNKTISGSIGSFVFSLIPILFIFLMYDTTKNTDLKIYLIDYPNIFTISLLISLFCQIGDLFISYFKRKAKVKDTGSILPGHGGILDRVDGVIFAIPSIFLINKLFF